MARRALFVVALAAVVSACNGGSTAPPPLATGTLVTPTPTPSPTPLPGSASGTLTTSTTQSTSLTLGPIGPGDMATTGSTPTNVVAHLAELFTLAQPAGPPALASMRKRPLNIGGAAISAFAFFTLTPDVTVTAPFPAFAMTFPAGATVPQAASSYVAAFDPGNAAAGWLTISGPAVLVGNTLQWTSSSFPFTFVAARTYTFALFTTSSTLALASPTPTPTPSPSPTPLPNAGQHLYVANDNTPGGIEQFTLPLTASSTPNFTIAGNDLVAVAVDANGNLAAGDFHHKIFVFTAPLSGFSTPSATFNNGTAGNVGQLTFVPSGAQANQLWAASVGTEIDRFVPPFTNATTAAQQTFPTGASQLTGLVFDASLNMVLANVNNLFVMAPPYNNPPAAVTPTLSDTSYRKAAVSGNQLIVAMPISTPQPLGRLDVYALPLTSSSVPAFTIVGSASPNNGVNVPEALAIDAAGNLYVGNLGNRTITVYAPPFSATSSPAVTLTLPSPFAIFGIAVGK